MAKQNKSEFLTKLTPESISSDLQWFQASGSIKELPKVLNLLHQFQNDEVEQKIIEIVSDIKVKTANAIILEAIGEAYHKGGNLRALVQIAWESRLDFTQNLALFTDIFIDKDYITALEAFTLIENIWMDYQFSDEHRNLLIGRLKSNLDQMDKDKSSLCIELIHILEQDAEDEMWDGEVLES
ncbi:MAG: hypothetical protein JXR60_10010 [Bacteroidales bacterium]|nr:hypothetical protein [Bacteroidales bacterium]